MKQSLSRSPLSRLSGFTLVELLVVVAIIAILASVILYAGGTALKSAKRAQAANTAVQIQTAALAYYTEYSIYPVPTSPAPTAGQDYLIADTTTPPVAWKALLYGLCGNINPYDGTTTSPTGAVSNTRAISFLTLRSSDVDSLGGPKNPLPTGTSVYFNICIDADYDNIIGDTLPATKLPNFVTSTTTITLYTLPAGPSGGVAVWANCNGSTTSTNPNFYVHTY
jgi:prepilin-type N-terminal cleavage/methylation domain-containing protein